MDRAKVILHMMTALDGKIEGYFADAPLTGICGDCYDDIIPKLGDAVGSGSYTAQLYMAKGKPDLAAFEGTEVPEGDYIEKEEGDTFLFVFDRKGKCLWDDVLCEGRRVVAVLTRQASLPYLAYLRSKGISYIFAGERDMEPLTALEKIKSLFGIHTLVLCGGATINGVFLKAGLVDGVSLVICPYIEGNHEQKGIAETDVFVPQGFVLKKAEPVANGKTVHLLYGHE